MSTTTPTIRSPRRPRASVRTPIRVSMQSNELLPVERVADTTGRLAALLAAGISPRTAWRYLCEMRTGYENDVVRAAATVAQAGGDIASELVRIRANTSSDENLAWRGLAAAWSVATTTGAPLAPCLRDFAQTLRQLGDTQRDITTALAGPRATARIVVALPAVSVLFGVALGFNTLETLLATVPGLCCLLTGVGLLIMGGRWNAQMIRSAQPSTLTPGLSIDLMAIAVTGGGSLGQARRLLTNTTRQYALHNSRDAEAIDSVLDLASRAGIPAMELLRAEAEQVRRHARSHGQRAAARLGVRLMIPLALCVLPAFMVLGVVPLMLSVISSPVTHF
jgi:tight adherence protein B